MTDRECLIVAFAERLFFHRMTHFTPAEVGEIWVSLDGLMRCCHHDAHRFYDLFDEVKGEPREDQ